MADELTGCVVHDEDVHDITAFIQHKGETRRGGLRQVLQCRAKQQKTQAQNPLIIFDGLRYRWKHKRQTNLGEARHLLMP